MRMTGKVYALVAMSLLAASLAGFGAMPLNSPAAQAPTPDTAEALALTPSPRESLLQAQVDEMRRSEDRLLQVIVGALSVLVLVNIVGYVIAVRSYDQVRDALIDKAERLIEKESLRASTQQHEFETALGDRLEGELRGRLAVVDERIGSFEQELSGQSARIKALETSTAETVRLIKELGEVENRRMNRLQTEIWRLNADLLVANGQPIRAIYYSARIGKLQAEMGTPIFATPVLDRILSGLRAIAPGDPMKDLTPQERTALLEFLDVFQPSDENQARTLAEIKETFERVDQERYRRQRQWRDYLDEMQNPKVDGAEDA
jgi:hypothetical protein